MSDIVGDIMRCCPLDMHDLKTAEGRAAWDVALRAELQKIEDDDLRRHAAAIIRDRRREIFGNGGVQLEIGAMHDMADLSARITRLENEVGALRNQIAWWV